MLDKKLVREQAPIDATHLYRVKYKGFSLLLYAKADGESHNSYLDEEDFPDGLNCLGYAMVMKL